MEEKYEHTNRSCNQKIPARVPHLSDGLGDGGGPCAFLRRMFVQIERLYSSALHSQAASHHYLERRLVLRVLCLVLKVLGVCSSAAARYWD
jgi:hypothetical protein